MSYALYGLGAAVAPTPRVAPGMQRGSFTIRVMHPSRTPVQRRPIVVELKRNGVVVEKKPLPPTGGRVVLSMPREPGTYEYAVIETTTRKVLTTGAVNFYASHLTQHKEKDVFLPTNIAYTRADRKRRRKARREARRDRRDRRRGVGGLGDANGLTWQNAAIGAAIGFCVWWAIKQN